MSSSIDFTSSLRELVNILRTINDLASEMVIPHTVGVNFGHRTVAPGKGRERLRRRLHSPLLRKENQRDALRIIATGLLILSAALSMKYGMYPCMRFNPASDSDASSAAMK
jgi:hypothetical protein